MKRAISCATGKRSVHLPHPPHRGNIQKRMLPNQNPTWQRYSQMRSGPANDATPGSRVPSLIKTKVVTVDIYPKNSRILVLRSIVRSKCRNCLQSRAVSSWVIALRQSRWWESDPYMPCKRVVIKHITSAFILMQTFLAAMMSSSNLSHKK